MFKQLGVPSTKRMRLFWSACMLTRIVLAAVVTVYGAQLALASIVVAVLAIVWNVVRIWYPTGWWVSWPHAFLAVVWLATAISVQYSGAPGWLVGMPLCVDVVVALVIGALYGPPM